jgi:hypothetical protein
MTALPGAVTPDYELVRLANGAFSVRSLAAGEVFHPIAGPFAEAELFMSGSFDCRSGRREPGRFVVWDVGLGAGGNALTAIRQLARRGRPRSHHQL